MMWASPHLEDDTVQVLLSARAELDHKDHMVLQPPLLAWCCLSPSQGGFTYVTPYGSTFYSAHPAHRTLRPLSWLGIAFSITLSPVCGTPPQAGFTALMLASNKGSDRVVKALVAAKAELNSCDSEATMAAWVHEGTGDGGCLGVDASMGVWVHGEEGAGCSTSCVPSGGLHGPDACQPEGAWPGRRGPAGRWGSAAPPGRGLPRITTLT